MLKLIFKNRVEIKMLKEILIENNRDAIIASIGYKTSTTGAGAWLYIEVK